MPLFKKRTAVEPVEETRAVVSISDPAVAELLGFGALTSTGITVTEANALTLSSVWRSVHIIASTIASLPLKTYRNLDDGSRVIVPSIFDNPAGPNMAITKFEWMETLVAHLVLHGNAYAVKVLNAAGVLVGLQLIHPLAVTVEVKNGFKLFNISLEDGQRVALTETEVLHIPALSMNGVVGLSAIQYARNSMGITLAGETASGKLFANGAMVAGIVTPEADEDLTSEDATAIRTSLNSNVTGYNNAGALAVINRGLKVSTWQLDAAALQFLESRAFQVEEIARWFGISPHLLMHTEKQTSWGTGIAEQNMALSRHTLFPYARRIESRFSALLANPRFVEFDFAGLERPNPEAELKLLMDQVNAGLLTLNEARAIRNLGPVEGGDELRVPSGVMLLSQLTAAVPADQGGDSGSV